MADTMTLTSPRRDASVTPTPNQTAKAISGDISQGGTDRSDIRTSLMRRAHEPSVSTSTNTTTISSGSVHNTSGETSFTVSSATSVTQTTTVINRRAEEQSLHALHHENEAQLIKRQNKLDEAVAQTPTAAAVVQPPVVEARGSGVERKAQMMEEVTKLAEASAKPGEKLNVEAAREELQKICQKYGDLKNLDAQEISSHFEKSYSESYEAKEKELPWYKRAWRSTCNVVKGGAKLLGDAGSWMLDKTVAGVTATVNFAKDVVTDPAKAWDQVKAVGTKVADVACDAGRAIGNGCSSAWSWVKENGPGLLQKGWDLSVAPLKAGFEVVKGLGNGLVDVGAALIGQKSWSEVGQNFMGAMHRAGGHLEAGYQIAKSALVATWHGIKGLSDSLGVSDLIVGVGHSLAFAPHLLWDAGKILVGQGSVAELMDHANGHMKGVANGVLGAGKCFVEVTGIADLYHAGVEGCEALAAYGAGDMAAFKQHSAMMAMHGAFAAMSIGTIAATVGTAGVAAGSIAAVAAGRATLKQAAKVVLKEGTEQFFKKGAAEIGEVALKDMIHNAPKVLASREGGAALLKQAEVHAAITGKSVADLAYKELLKVEARSGAVQTAKTMAEKGLEGASLKGAEAIARDVGEARTKTLLKEMGLDKIVDKHTYELLVKGADTDTKTLAKEFGEKYGFAAEKANKMAKEVKDALKSGKSDTEIKQLLEDGISKPISKSLSEGMESEYKQTMKKAVRGECEELGEKSSKQLKEAVEKNAERAGKQVEKYQDELVEATWKGYREGIEAGTRAVVREGIEQAFKRFRERETSRRGAGGASGFRDVENGDTLGELPAKPEVALGAGKHDQEEGMKSHENLVRQRTVTGPQGEIIHIKEAFDANKNQWTLVSSEVEITKAA